MEPVLIVLPLTLKDSRWTWDAQKCWISTEAATIYDDMMKLRNEHPVESMSDKSIIENVLGRSSVRLHGWGRDPINANNTMSTTKRARRPTYDELVDVLQIVVGKYAVMEQALIENNIMPPSTTSVQSEGDISEGGENINE